MGTGFLWEEENKNVLELEMVMVVTTLWIYLKNTEWYTLDEWILWYVNYVSIKWLFFLMSAT